MGSITSLTIHSGVPIDIVEDDGVSCDQVDSETSSPGRQQKDKGPVRFLEFIDHVPSVVDVGGTVESEVDVLLPGEVVLKDVHHTGHLAEDQAPVATFEPLFEELIQLLEFGTVCQESVVLRDVKRERLRLV
jgi:hypothetical protein